MELGEIVDGLERKVYEAGERHGYGKKDCETSSARTFELSWELSNAVHRELVEILERDYLPVLAFEKWAQIAEGVSDEVENEGHDRFGPEYVRRLSEAIERTCRQWCREMAEKAMAAMFDTPNVSFLGPQRVALCDLEN